MRLQNLLLILAVKNTYMLYILRLFHISHASYEPSTITESQTRLLNTKKTYSAFINLFGVFLFFRFVWGARCRNWFRKYFGQWHRSEHQNPQQVLGEISPEKPGKCEVRKNPRKSSNFVNNYPMTDSHGTCVFLPT